MIQAWAPTTPNVMALNSAGLAKLGITADLPDQVGRVTIHKDAAGEPTGLLSGAVNNYYSNEPFTEELMRQLPLLDPAAIGPGTESLDADVQRDGRDLRLRGPRDGLPADRRLPVAARRGAPQPCACSAAPEAEPYGLPWNESPDRRRSSSARLEQAAGMVQRTDDMLRIDGVTIGRGGPCGPGFILMRDPYKGPFGEHDHRRVVRRAKSARRWRCASRASAACGSTS